MKHTTKTVFWRYAKIRISVPIHRINISSRKSPKTLTRKRINVSLEGFAAGM